MSFKSFALDIRQVAAQGTAIGVTTQLASGIILGIAQGITLGIAQCIAASIVLETTGGTARVIHKV